MAESDEGLVELPLDGAGIRLRRAREAAGLQLSDIAARTRIAERHLVSLENGNFNAMASRAYAIGFARSYARTLGLDEQVIAAAVRDEMDGQEPSSDRYQPAAFEPGDPARVPSARIAWVAALGALVVVVAGFWLWRSFYAPAMPLPAPAAEATASQAAAGGEQVAVQGPVVFTALEQGVWVKFYDSADKQLLQKQMALGETYTIPPEAVGPMIRTARPDALQISIGGRIVGKLSDRQMDIKDVPVTAAALLARPSALTTALPTALTPATAAVPAGQARPQPSAAATRPAATRPAAQEAARPAATVPSPSPAASAVAAPAPAAPATPQSSTVSQ